jgi:hypothetical protein
MCLPDVGGSSRGGTATRREGRLRLNGVYEALNQSIVKVRADSSAGSGALVDARAMIATNQHVVRNARYVAVGFADGRKVATVGSAVADTLTGGLLLDLLMSPGKYRNANFTRPPAAIQVLQRFIDGVR